MPTDDLRVERHYRDESGERRAALLVEEQVVATLDANDCFALADDLVAAGERLATPNGGDSEQLPPCPECGDPVTRVTLPGPGTAILSPCGHEVSPAHPIVSDDTDDNDNDS